MKMKSNAFKYIGVFAAAVIMLFAFMGAKKELVFGMTVLDSTPPYAQAMIYCAEKTAKALGAKVVGIDSQKDVLNQLDQMDSSLSMNVDGLIFGGAINPAAVIPGIKKFNEKKIPIMAPGVVQAIEQAGLKPADYFITGICMGPEGRDLIKEGKAYAIIGQPAQVLKNLRWCLTSPWPRAFPTALNAFKKKKASDDTPGEGSVGAVGGRVADAAGAGRVRGEPSLEERTLGELVLTDEGLTRAWLCTSGKTGTGRASSTSPQRRAS